MHTFDDLTVKALDEEKIQVSTSLEHFVPTEAPDTAVPLTQYCLHDENLDATLYTAQEVTTSESAERSDSFSNGGVQNSSTTNMDDILQLSKLIGFPDFIPPVEKRMFLELFSGSRYPLSSHIRSLGVKVLC